ncbi:MAG: type IV secretory system conjugative DNA transfer family protein [Pseudomonadota bacterium]
MSNSITPPDLMDGIPRGVSTKYMRDQSIPQARWQNQESIANHKPLEYDPQNPGGKILIGALGAKLIGIEDNRHLQTTAGNRSGKSVTVISNLLFYDGSVFAIDVKGELSETTAIARARLGQDVVILDPFNIVRGEAKKFRGRYNPLRKLSLDSDTVIEDGMQIVDAIIEKTGQEKDPHWNESAASAMLGFILYAAFGDDVPKEEGTLITVRRFITGARAQEVIDEDRQGYTLPRRMMRGIEHLKNGKHDDVAETIEASVRGLYEKSHDEMAGVLSTMNRHTAFLEFRAMRRIFSGHDCDLKDLKRKKNGMSVYAVLPATRMNQCSRLLRIFVNQLIEAMEEEKTVPKAPVLAVLDEFPVLKRMESLEAAAGQIASYHVKIWTILQDWGQGKALYKERWESFAANAGVQQFFANVDLASTEYVTKRLGKTPVVQIRQGDTSYEQREKGMSGAMASKQLYDLLAHDEVARTFARSDPLKRQLVMMAGLNPMILQRVEWWNKNAPYAHYFKEFHKP